MVEREPGIGVAAAARALHLARQLGQFVVNQLAGAGLLRRGTTSRTGGRRNCSSPARPPPGWRTGATPGVSSSWPRWPGQLIDQRTDRVASQSRRSPAARPAAPAARGQVGDLVARAALAQQTTRRMPMVSIDPDPPRGRTRSLRSMIRRMLLIEMMPVSSRAQPTHDGPDEHRRDALQPDPQAEPGGSGRPRPKWTRRWLLPISSRSAPARGQLQPARCGT